MKIRIKFRKFGVMRFIGHLDIMRYFQKAICRAGIDIRYSEGFSPHQVMSFAAPLGVGLTSDGEYMDIEVNSTGSSAWAIQALNGTMAEGIEVIGYVRLPDDAKPAMSIVAAADYEIWFKEGYAPPALAGQFSAGLHAFFEEPAEVLVTKKTKKGERTVDLKKLVYGLNVEEREGSPYFSMRLGAGSTDNVKPELVLEALFASMGLSYVPAAVQIHRKDVYAADASGKGFVPLGELGEVVEGDA